MKRIILMSMAALVVLLSVSVASAADGLMAYVFNRSSDIRVVNIYITTGSGAVAKPMRALGPNSEILFDFAGHDSEKQKWNFYITNQKGERVSEACVIYSDGRFSADEIGVGIVYTNYTDKEFRLELTK